MKVGSRIIQPLRSSSSGATWRGRAYYHGILVTGGPTVGHGLTIHWECLGHRHTKQGAFKCAKAVLALVQEAK